MKKLHLAMLWLLLFLSALLPAGHFLTGLWDYDFFLFSDFGYALILAVLSLAAALFSFSKKAASGTRTAGVLSTVLLPLSALDLLSFLLAPTNSDPAVLFLFFCLVCAVVLTARRARPKALRIASLSVFALLVTPVCLVTFFWMAAWGERSVISQHSSPENLYLAEVVCIDQGALGGDTSVYIHDNTAPQFNAGLFRISPKPRLIYQGAWHEYKNLSISWADEHSLVIQGQCFPLD